MVGHIVGGGVCLIIAGIFVAAGMRIQNTNTVVVIIMGLCGLGIGSCLWQILTSSPTDPPIDD